MKIRLVKNGVFPIIKNSKGKNIGHNPKTDYLFSGTLQGEGKLLGIPVLFVRLSGCNLRCSWQTENGEIDICDTPYSSHHPNESEELETDEVVRLIENNLMGIRHIIISGGEPTLQPKAIAELCRKLKRLDLHITLETNGVIFHKEITEYIDLFSISPKLSPSSPSLEKIKRMKNPLDVSFVSHHEKNRKNIETIQNYINACHISDNYYNDTPASVRSRKNDKDFQLKFVISRKEDAFEIKNDFLRYLNHYKNEDIVLMPLGSSRDFLMKTFQMTAQMAVENRWRFTPRTHIDLFNRTQYV
jgi:7-carboxy-7-deazaguanine synthase